MKKIIKIVLIVLLIAFVVIQFFRPERTSTHELNENDITKKMQVPEDVQRILKRSCYDCHSNQTFWPWYSNVAPVSWLLADDVRGGRAKMNFSEWGKLSESKQESRLENICDLITEGEMPLPKYLYLHRDAVLTQQEKDILCKWTEDELKKREENE